MAFRRNRSAFGFRIRREFCRAVMRALGVRVALHGLPYRGACLYISNHRSMLDPLIELGYLDTYILSKAEVASYPLIGPGARATGVFFVERHKADSRKAALQSVEHLLKNGYQVLIYPEGTTHAVEYTSDFKPGTFEVAAKMKMPVVPVMIEYPDSSYYWTDGSLMQYFMNIFSARKTHHVQLEIGLPVFEERSDILLQKVQEDIIQMIGKHRQANAARI